MKPTLKMGDEVKLIASGIKEFAKKYFPYQPTGLQQAIDKYHAIAASGKIGVITRIDGKILQ